MLIAATFFSTNLSKQHERWRIEKTGGPTAYPLSWEKRDFRSVPPDELGPSIVSDYDCAGLMVIYDWDQSKIVWRSDWDPLILVPSGFCFADGSLYVNDSESAALFQIELQPDFGRISRRISHPYFNDLHSLLRTSRGFLVTSSGIDAIVEVDPFGKLLFEWWAADHGFNETPSGVRRESGRGTDHRGIYYHTRFHATHVNSALIQDESERHILALLFQQGVLVQLDRSLPEQEPRLVLDGLIRPHGLERTPRGWLFCNTLGEELVMLGLDLKTCERIPYKGTWIQDCTMLSNGNILLADVDQHLIVELISPTWEIGRIVECDPEWRLAELNEVPASCARHIAAQLARQNK